jgi:hypothetical protein
MTKTMIRKEPNQTSSGKPNLKTMGMAQLEEMKRTARPKNVPKINNRMNTMLRKAGRGR